MSKWKVFCIPVFHIALSPIYIRTVRSVFIHSIEQPGKCVTPKLTTSEPHIHVKTPPCKHCYHLTPFTYGSQLSLALWLNASATHNPPHQRPTHTPNTSHRTSLSLNVHSINQRLERKSIIWTTFERSILLVSRLELLDFSLLITLQVVILLAILYGENCHRPIYTYTMRLQYVCILYRISASAFRIVCTAVIRLLEMIWKILLHTNILCSKMPYAALNDSHSVISSISKAIFAPPCQFEFFFWIDSKKFKSKPHTICSPPTHHRLRWPQIFLMMECAAEPKQFVCLCGNVAW